MVTIGIIDGPCDDTTLSKVMKKKPIILDGNFCTESDHASCKHGTFMVCALGARESEVVPGLCPDCRIIHVPWFSRDGAPGLTLKSLADAIKSLVLAGVNIINLSFSIVADDEEPDVELENILDYCGHIGILVIVAAGNESREPAGQLVRHPATIPVVAVDEAGHRLRDSNHGKAISQRGLGAIGKNVPGYGPGGSITTMTGSSPAAVRATGLIARTWSLFHFLSGTEVRKVLANLGRYQTRQPPLVTEAELKTAFDNIISVASIVSRAPTKGMLNFPIAGGYNQMAGSIDYGRNTSVEYRKPNVGALALSHSADSTSVGCTCGCSSSVIQKTFVYALGSVDLRFSDQSISEELQLHAASLGMPVEATANTPLREWYYKALSSDNSRYIARLVTWILKIEGLPAYYLKLKDASDLSVLIESLGGPEDDHNLVVGTTIDVSADICPGLQLRVLEVDQIAAIQTSAFVAAYAEQPQAAKKALAARDQGYFLSEPSPQGLFDCIIQSADNLGDTDNWRAINFIAARYRPVYELHAKISASDGGWFLDGIKVVPSRLSREQRIVDPIFVFKNRKTGIVQQYFMRVDVSGIFPVVISPLTEYFDRHGV